MSGCCDMWYAQSFAQSYDLITLPRCTFAPGTRLAVAGTIQFAASVHYVQQKLKQEYPTVDVPQAKPLSPGEVLGCTAPVLQGDYDAIVFVADGRFHLEAIMIANPAIPAYRLVHVHLAAVVLLLTCSPSPVCKGTTPMDAC